MDCLTNLVGVKELCAEAETAPLFYLDDIEGLDRLALGQLAKPSNGNGLAFGNEIIESSSRFLLADLETIIPKGYAIKSSLNSFCNTCTYTSLNSATPFTGVIVKSLTTSSNSYLSIDSLKVMLGSTGTFTVVLDDGIAPKIISDTFTAGAEKIITNINFKTTAKSVKIYINEEGVLMTTLNCPVAKSCGCSGGGVTNKDLTVKGLLNNAEFGTQYAFVPCASIVCSIDNIICNIINQQPKLFALTLLYRSASRYFSEFPVTQRINRNASFDEPEKAALADRYMALYYERLNGSSEVKGIADNMKAAFDNLNDSCIDCKRQTGVAWAIG